RDVTPDHLQLDVVAQRHALDGAVGGPHAAADLAAFEGRAGGRRRAEIALHRAEHDLTVGTDVDEDPQLVLPGEAGSADAGDDVRADVGPDHRQGLDVPARMDVETHLAGGKVER